jgi:hypothetical protein
MPNPEQDHHRPAWRTYLAAYERAVSQFQADPTPANLALLQTGEEILSRELWKPGRFELGQTVATPGAVEAMQRGFHIPPEFLLRHKHGDWGELGDEDKQTNDQGLISGSRLLSAYTTRTSERLWVITEWDRSVTTLLLPAEY